MTIQSEIVSALAGIASHANAPLPDVIDNVYPEAAPEDAVLPLVIFRRSDFEPLNTLEGGTGWAKSTFVFECWASTKGDAIALADAVAAAIKAADAIVIKAREPSSGDDYEPEGDQFLEPVVYSFWHA